MEMAQWSWKGLFGLEEIFLLRVHKTGVSLGVEAIDSHDEIMSRYG